jgi:hypothetical protein
LGGLLGSLGALVVTGLVSRIDVIRHPYLQRQVHVFDRKPGKLLQMAQTIKIHY